MNSNDEKLLYCPSASPYLWTDKLRENERTIFKSRCKRWDCPYCAEVNRLQHWIRISRGINGLSNNGYCFDFITLTSHERLSTTVATYRVWQSAWAKLSTRLRRTYEAAYGLPLAFVYTLELHKDGRIHMHGIVSGHIKTRWYKDNARACGLGYQAKSARLDDPAQAINYISKYVSKQMGTHIGIERFRRVNYSRNFNAHDEDESGVAWNILDKHTSIATLIEGAWHLGKDVTLHGKIIEEILTE